MVCPFLDGERARRRYAYVGRVAMTKRPRKMTRWPMLIELARCRAVVRSVPCAVDNWIGSSRAGLAFEKYHVSHSGRTRARALFVTRCMVWRFARGMTVRRLVALSRTGRRQGDLSLDCALVNSGPGKHEESQVNWRIGAKGH
jgi:hypothetical protein